MGFVPTAQASPTTWYVNGGGSDGNNCLSPTTSVSPTTSGAQACCLQRLLAAGR